MTNDGVILVALDSFAVRYEGADHSFTKGVSRVRAGHPILTRSNSGDITHLFEPIEPHYEIEQATAAPGEQRRGPGRPRKHPLPA